jgi:hypothetical protein
MSSSRPPDVSFGATVRALITLYKHCEESGAVELARRVQRALVVLVGPQKHLHFDDENVQEEIKKANDTLRGLGGFR